MTLLAAEPKQFQLKDDGQICFQADPTNPLPGVPVARLIKGAGYLQPTIEWLGGDGFADIEVSAASEKISTWFALHVAKVLEPLVKLTAEMEALPEAVRHICQAVHDGLGIVPRQDILDDIEKLDAETRKTLRTRHVRLGPVLVFIPDLNKPAAVRLKALLWSLYHDQALPAPVPKDGAVSVVIEPMGANPAFYQAMGYPLYANRIIRIDMLDRVINAVYENVKDNQFQAKHQMAEWLGCSIPDLYIVLEAMGHKKVSDPADAKVDSASADALVAVVPVEEAPGIEEKAVAEPVPATYASATPETPAVKPATVKPELATFKVWWPRKNNKPPREHKPRRAAKEAKSPKTPPPFEYLDPAEVEAKNKANADKKEWRHDKKDGDGNERGFNRDRAGGARGVPKHGHQGGARKSKPNRTDKNLRLVSSAAAPASKPEDSPFAVLASLKFKNE